jgi:creatinine amidohydrolase/Fe(II)-dependent formamide hydrolase-like protein
MNRIRLAAAAALLLPMVAASAQLSKNPPKGPLVEFERMTWPEVKQALEQGKTTALIYTGGTEQRGPQNANGGHTLMARYTAKAIAIKLGNAIVMPVLPYTPNNASAQLPGTIGLTPELLTAVLTRIVEQTFATGFKNVIIMGDHGGGQPNAYKAVVDSLEPKYAAQGKHVYFCDEVYEKAQADFDKWLADNGYPVSSHAGIPDTSTMLMLDSTNVWVRRDLIPEALGDPVQPRGAGRRGASDPNAPPRKNNGITGDARRSSAELGRRAFNIKVDYAVRQIHEFLASQK